MSMDGAFRIAGNTGLWPVKLFREVMRQRKEVGRIDLPTLGVSLARGVTERQLDDGRPAASIDQSNYKVVYPGDIIMNALGKPHGSIGESQQFGITSPAYWVLELDDSLASSRFFHYLLRSDHAINEYKRLGKYLPPNQFDLPWDQFRDIRFPLPPLDEQRRIADFLDDQVGRINQAIELRRQQLDLLNTAFDAKLRESILGVGTQNLGWASGIGDDREIRRIGSLLRIRGERNDPIRLEQILSLTAARGVIRYEDKGDIGNKASDDISRYNIVRKGDIVLNSMNVIVGSVGISRYQGVLSPVYYVMCPIAADTISMEFLAYHFRIREFQRQLIKLGYGILDHRMRIPWVNLKAEKLAVPPLAEQKQIVSALQLLDTSREQSLLQLTNGLVLLEERRGSLITDAVTGKFDVSTARSVGVGS